VCGCGRLRKNYDEETGTGWELIPQSALGVSEAEEPHQTFVENALAKARHAAASTGLPALADDSGICLAALGGEPGVHSARFAGEPKSDARNNALMLEKLAGVANRRAHYVCVLVFVRSANDPQPVIAEGEWHGEIVDVPRGDGGFGYDPYFWLPQFSMTVAELPADQKNALSHRGVALKSLLQRLGDG
jgi:XTP/dITP diphosphohydrolase